MNDVKRLDVQRVLSHQLTIHSQLAASQVDSSDVIKDWTCKYKDPDRKDQDL